MPKKRRQTKAEVHATIVQESKRRIGCADFAPDFTLYEVHDQMANWDVQGARNKNDWAPDCLQAFREAVARARRKLDTAWP